jgi:hypothetical protein
MILAHHNMAHWLWKGIADSTKGWIITTKQTVVGLPGLQQPEDQIQVDARQWAWDEVTNVLLEGEEEQADADMTTQQKRQDTWAVNWDKGLLILKFTRPNNRCKLYL